MHDFFNNVIDSSIIGQIYANYHLIMMIFIYAYGLYGWAVVNIFIDVIWKKFLWKIPWKSDSFLFTGQNHHFQFQMNFLPVSPLKKNITPFVFRKSGFGFSEYSEGPESDCPSVLIRKSGFWTLRIFYGYRKEFSKCWGSTFMRTGDNTRFVDVYSILRD